MSKKSTNTVNENSLEQALKDRTAEVKLLQDSFHLIANELDLDKIFNAISKRARELVDAETVLIPLLDNDNENYTYKAGAGNNVNEIVGESLPLDYGVCGWVWKHKRPWWKGVLNDLSEEERNKWEKEAGSILMVPLQGKINFLGGISAINKKNNGEFSQRDLNLLTIFANIASIAIENAININELEKTQHTLIEHQFRLERLNKQYSETSYKVEQLSLYDSLTNIPNRTLFRDRINTQLKVSNKSHSLIALILFDIDNFKSVNDTLGHDNGDKILVEFCKRIKKQINSNEFLCRLGSDEFVLITPKNSEEEILKLAHNISDKLNASYNINNKEFSINASIGISIYPQHGKDRSTLLRHADIALNKAKKDNKKIHLFNTQTDETSDTQLSLALDLNIALEKNQFEIYYQAQIDIQTNSLVSAEALGRWIHPTRGTISPLIFIEALEQYNLIDQYTYSVIDKVVQSITCWASTGYNLKIAVNISTHTLMNPDFISNVESLIPNFSISRRLVFEITESLFLSDYDHVHEALTRLRAMGIELSIDDFGTGYSSLSRLKRLPVNELKIDQSFIKDMQHSFDDQVIVKSIIDLAHNLGLTVVAEGVETREVLLQLHKLGCDIAQGYLFSKPIPKTEFEAFMSHYKA